MNKNQNQMNQPQPGRGNDAGRMSAPISNEAYNVITALQAKLEGLEAYRKYSKDPGAEIWQHLAQTELESVDTLCTELERLVRDGKLRGSSSGGDQGRH